MVAARVREVMENVLIKRNEKGNDDLVGRQMDIGSCYAIKTKQE